MTLIAVARDKFATGVEAPGTKPKKKGKRVWLDSRDPTYDWREPPKSDANTVGVEAVYRVMRMADAFALVYLTDAHFVSYYLVGHDGAPLAVQPRLNKGGLEWVLAQGLGVEHQVVTVDVDNANHEPWASPQAGCDALLTALERLPGVGGYVTRKGLRFVQLLDEPLSAAEAEGYIVAFMDELAEAGIQADPSCRDWTRHMRLPNIRLGPRNNFRSPLIEIARCQARKLSPKAGPGVLGAGGRGLAAA